MTISELPVRQAIEFQEYNCRECDTLVIEKDVRLTTKVRTALIEGKLCHECHHWTTLAEYMGPCAAVRVDGHHYMFDTRLPYVANPVGDLGYGGKLFVIQFTLTGAELITNNLWFQGVIPERFKHRLPDNAVFIPYEERKD